MFCFRHLHFIGGRNHIVIEVAEIIIGRLETVELVRLAFFIRR